MSLGSPLPSSGELSPEESGTQEVLTFRLGKQAFGIRVLHVREVLDHKPIAPLANAPETLLGMIDVRGIGVPVVDLKHKLRMSVGRAGEPTTDSRIVVLEFDEAEGRRTLAVIADAVFEVADIDETGIEDAPRFGESWNSDFMTGIGRRDGDFLTLLDIPRLFAPDAVSDRPAA